MIARTTASVGLLVGAGLLVGYLAACSNDSGNNTPVAPPPNTSGSGGAGVGGGVLPTGGSSGSTAAGTTSGGASGAGGASACKTNELLHPDDHKCHCQPASLMQCMDGCFDLPNDPEHCGDCMTKCGPTQACSAGKCGAAPTVLVPAPAACGGVHMAVSGGKVYWTDTMAGTVSSVAIAGGAVTPVVPADAASKPTQLAVSATAVFWLASGSNKVMTAPIAGGAATALVSGTGMDMPTAMPPVFEAIHGLALSADGMNLYFSEGKAVKKIVLAPTPAAPVEVGHEDTGIPHGLAISADSKYVAYPADVNGDIDVMVVAGTPSVCSSNVGAGGGGGGGAGGGSGGEAPNMNCNRLGRSQGDLILDTVFIVGDNAYWANAADVTTSSVSKPTGFNTIIASASTVNPNTMKVSAMTVTADKAYFADKAIDTDMDPAHSGYIYKSASLMASADVTIMARAQKGPTSITTDATNVYWATGDCAIMSMPK
ncbi:MAG TPA: hypothetical protein VNG33_05905 [Polyangiaceae bacterium]|nr:hypothetical protein [Polyangiaceae bacterium]